MNEDLPFPEPGGLSRSGANWCFFLDVDGTLIELADTPEGVSVDSGVIGLLRSLHGGAGGAVALVSGRPIAQLDGLFRPLRLPAAGLHGLEMRTDGDEILRAAPPGAALGRIRERLAAFAAERPGVIVEDKELTVALHYRRAPETADAARAVIDEVAREFGNGYDVLEGKMVFEIKPSGWDKGMVVGAFMAERPFSGRRPVFVGDDVTDEDGFDAVNRAGGHSIRIGGGVTRARYRIADVPGLRRWLADMAALSGDGG